MKNIAVRCTFRSRGYPEEEIEELRADLDEIAVLRAQRCHYPEAGGCYEMSVIVQFVGVTLLSGIIYDVTKVLGRSFYNLYKKKDAKQKDHVPELNVFELRFDDFDIRIRGNSFEHGEEGNFISERAFDHFPSIIESIKDHLETEPLKSTDKMVIDIFEPDISYDKDNKLILDFNHLWKIEGTDVMAPKSYSPNERKLGNEYISSP